VTPEVSLSLAFMTGILGSFHCLGMCSGINGGFFMHSSQGVRLPPLLAFHTMRISVYTLLGISGAVLGQVLVQSGIVGKVQGILMILAGVVIILLGLNLLGLPWLSRRERNSTLIVVPLASLRKKSPLMTALSAGLFNGLVPCSLVFSVAVKAAATAEPLSAGLMMLSFGAGTLPSMVVVSLVGASVGAALQGGLAKLAGVVVTLLGLWTLYEGVVFYDIMRGLANW
jgi:uncharacterized protein